jgi:ribosome maturation factor RimP
VADVLATFFCLYRSPRHHVNDALEPLAAQELERLGYELVEFRRGGSRSRPLFEVRIDRRDLQKVTTDDCAVASRALEARFEGEGGLRDQRYVLEVSSPGLDRPLRHAADWRRFAGRRASVKSPTLGGRAEVTIVAVEDDARGAVAVVRDGQGAERRLALADVAEARLAFHWDDRSRA